MRLNEETLRALGLPPMQGRVYVAALELGQATIQVLARKSGVNRSTIYTFIDDLKARGYMFETKRARRKMYSAVNPEHVLATERQRVQALENFLPQLQAINNAAQKKPKVTYFEGMNGIREVYKDMLRDKNDITAYEDLQHLKEGLPADIFTWFPAARAQQKIKINAISRDSVAARAFSKNNDSLLRETKFIKTNDLKTDINIYGDKIALMDLRGTPPFCVLIQNKHLADTLRTIWGQLWDRLQ